MELVDFYDDHGKLIGLDNVKEASELSNTERPKLPDEAYAYPKLKKFPLDTKDNAVTSAAYIVMQQDKFASESDFKEAVAKAEKALEVHDAVEEFKTLIKVAKKLTYKERKQLPPSVFGIPELKKYPMPDAEHVRKAITFFDKAPEEHKPKLARRIMQKAKQFGVEVHSDKVLKYAGYTDLKKAAHQLRTFRYYLITEKTPVREAYYKIARELESYEEPYIAPEELDKIASAVRTLDDVCEKEYGIKFRMDPEQFLYVKQSEEKEVLIKLKNKKVPIERILEIPDDKLEEILGTTITKDNPEVAAGEIESLPDPEKELLEIYLSK